MNVLAEKHLSKDLGITEKKNNFSADLHTKKRVEEVLDAGKFYTKESFLDGLNQRVSQIFGVESRVDLLQIGHGDRYFNPLDRGEVMMPDEEKILIQRSLNKAQVGSHGIYMTIHDPSDGKRVHDFVVRISGVPEGKITPTMLTGIRDLREQFRKTNTAIQVQNEDVLTGLYNRYFIERYAKEADNKKDTTYAVIAIDLIDLKGLNKNGLAIGDLGLQKVAKILKKAFPRNSDLVARPGGDEFTIILEFPASLTKNMQESLVQERMQTVMTLLASGDDSHGLHHLGKIDSVLAIRWGAGYRDDGATFSERHATADKQSNINKSDSGMISRAEEAVSQTNLKNAMRIAKAALARMRELSKNTSLEESPK